MELHISSDDATFVANVCSDIEERVGTLKGYASISGYNLKNPYEFKVFKGQYDISDRFPKRMTFGDMINMMKNAHGKFYFQREDWRNTHNFISLNNSDGRNLYIEQYYEDSRYKDGDQYFDENGIPLVDSKPYIPTYDDMFIHSWIVCDFDKGNVADDEEEKNLDGCTI